MTTPEKSQLAHYIRTTSMLSVTAPLNISNFCAIRLFSAAEAKKLGTQVRKQNLFAHQYRGVHFYTQRARELGNHSIIEFYLDGEPKEIIDDAEQIASYLESVVLLSTAFVMKKDDLQRRLGVSSRLGNEFDFIFSLDFYHISSKTRPTPICKGINIDERFRNRFFHCGFTTLVEYLRSKSDIASRVIKSIDWLFDSRIEPRQQASVVKTSTALESLLIFNESESLANSLSERTAFILSSDPNKRQQISRIIKNFYDIRSGVVHGSQKKLKKLTPELLESVDRLALMLCLVIAANSRLWPTTDALREWCETQRWGEPSRNVIVPFPDLYLNNALNLRQIG